MGATVISFLVIVAFPLTMVSVSYSKAVRYYAEKALLKRDEKRRKAQQARLARENAARSAAALSKGLDPADTLDDEDRINDGDDNDDDDEGDKINLEDISVVLEINEGPTNSPPMESDVTVEESMYAPFEKSASQVNFSDADISTGEACGPIPLDANDSNTGMRRRHHRQSFPGVVQTVMEHQRSGRNLPEGTSMNMFEQKLLHSLGAEGLSESTSIGEFASASFIKAANLLLGKKGSASGPGITSPSQSVVSSPTSSTAPADWSVVRAGRPAPGSLIASGNNAEVVRNLTEVNLVVVDWDYRNGPLKMPKSKNGVTSAGDVKAGTFESLAQDDDDDEDLDHEERGQRYGWERGDRLNMTLAIRNEQQFRKLLRMLGDLEA